MNLDLKLCCAETNFSARLGLSGSAATISFGFVHENAREQMQASLQKPHKQLEWFK
jgi:hypothetical protein